MSIRRSLLMLRGLTSLLATLALFVGVPLLLVVSVGWPLPTALPSTDALEAAARSGVDDQVIIKILAIIAWIAWAQLALSLVAEAVALVRGRQAIRLPVLPAVQVAAAHLVAGVLLLVSTPQPAHAVAPPPPLPVMAEVTATTTLPAEYSLADLDDVAGGLVDARGSPAAAPAVEQPTITVQRHDSYWSIAERTLGDGLRWREILDLNAGRTLADGTIIRAGDDTIHSGWILLLPGDATIEPVAAQSNGSASATAEADDLTTVVVEPGDNLWSISEDRLDDDLGREAADPEVVPYWREVIGANQDRFVEAGDPDLIEPGQVLVLPPTRHEDSPQPSDESAKPEEPPPRPPRADPQVPAEGAGPSTTTAPVGEGDSPDRPVDESERAESGDSSDTALPVAMAVERGPCCRTEAPRRSAPPPLCQPSSGRTSRPHAGRAPGASPRGCRPSRRGAHR